MWARGGRSMSLAVSNGGTPPVLGLRIRTHLCRRKNLASGDIWHPRARGLNLLA